MEQSLRYFSCFFDKQKIKGKEQQELGQRSITSALML